MLPDNNIVVPLRCCWFSRGCWLYSALWYCLAYSNDWIFKYCICGFYITQENLWKILSKRETHKPSYFSCNLVEFWNSWCGTIAFLPGLNAWIIWLMRVCSLTLLIRECSIFPGSVWHWMGFCTVERDLGQCLVLPCAKVRRWDGGVSGGGKGWDGGWGGVGGVFQTEDSTVQGALMLKQHVWETEKLFP